MQNNINNEDKKDFEPMFSEPLYVGKPNIGDKELYYQMMDDVFERRWLTNNGKYVKMLEKQLCEYLGVKHAIPVCNATIGLEIATRALGFEGEVIVPSFTFVATAHILQWQGIKPIFIDVDPVTHSIDEKQIEACITPNTTGIIGVHLWGNACNVEKIEEIARKHNLKVLYDAAHAMGCSHNGTKIGNFGSCEVFSFHATKVFNTFEGGAITTNDDELADKIRFMINFGFAGYDDVEYIGLNAKMNESSAAMGIVNLKHIDEFIKQNKARYEWYKEALEEIDGVELYPYNEGESNYHYIVTTIDESKLGVTRDELWQYLKENSIIARRYFYPGCHHMEPYNTLYKGYDEKLLVTNELCKKVLVLPNSIGIGKEEIEKICSVFKKFKK